MTNVIRGLRNMKGYTQEEVAKEIGMNARTFCIKERDPQSFKVGEIEKIAKLFGVEVGDFFKKEVTFKVT